ncbi:MAG: hypothetical protein JOY81_12360 [Alphaproteobacteria bacterium]|nr:hypothetical protein [Alphaproteobacteria bacterium]
MTAGPMSLVPAGRRRHALAGAAALGAALLLVLAGWMAWPTAPAGPTVGDRLTTLETARAALQARADADARIALLPAFRVASLLTDALVLRGDGDRGRAAAALPADRRQVLDAADALNAALADALVHPGRAPREAARAATARAQAALDRLAGDGLPLVLQFTPRFVPPRRAAGELALAPRSSARPAAQPATRPAAATAPRLEETAKPAGATAAGEVPLVPRYAPDFAVRAIRDFPLAIEVAATGFDEDAPPILAIGTWQGPATVSPLRLRFSVPRSAFATNAARTGFVTGLLSARRRGRMQTFQLLFTVLPDQPGSFALDQKVRTFVPEANTLVSPEILVRAEAGKTRSLRRCFDPPAGQRFDKSQRRIVSIERLGWLGDESDTSLNDGTAEFAQDEKRDQVCLVVTAKSANKDARTATIARFEATLVRQTPEERGVQSGVRALDWNAAVRLPVDPDMAEGRLYLHLLGEIDLQADRLPKDREQVSFPFVTVSREGNMLVLRADPGAAPGP